MKLNSHGGHVLVSQLVESTFLWKLHDLHGSEVHASDSIHLTPVGLETGICVKPQQYAMHCNAMSSEIRLLSKPFKIFEFDFWKRPNSHGETELHIQASDNGTVHAVISWWVLQLDYEGRIFYSTAPLWISSPFNTREEVTYAPGATDCCDHWKQCVWFIPGT
ncbi:protein arginine N-methyltransferase 7-like isoform X2 [Magnolia sinica]|uniref:protein arginine N-methyltransferase 7-like isoform X2 n=1 Tax=Magnolia sinica TaxID=86752 RepID=UPI0026597531|nr:protein arginine N-methyltransferase 7-like isoform X2 [Magnolia sinica]